VVVSFDSVRDRPPPFTHGIVERYGPDDDHHQRAPDDLLSGLFVVVDGQAEVFIGCQSR
jgi:hypothetical protein